MLVQKMSNKALDGLFVNGKRQRTFYLKCCSMAKDWNHTCLSKGIDRKLSVAVTIALCFSF
jgi:hypothetical protein